jgi:hypothetical protein
MRKLKSRDSEKLAYCVLCYASIHGKIDLCNSLNEILFTRILEKVKISNFTDIDIKDAVDDLEGLYLLETSAKQLYKIAHETISEALLISFGQLDPEIVVKCCNKRTLCELIRTQKYECKPEEVVLKIPPRHYEDLAERLLGGENVNDAKQDVENVKTDVLFHPACFDPEFVSVLLNRKMSDRLSNIFSEIWKVIFIRCDGQHDVLMNEMFKRFGPHPFGLTQTEPAEPSQESLASTNSNRKLSMRNRRRLHQ